VYFLVCSRVPMRSYENFILRSSHLMYQTELDLSLFVPSRNGSSEWPGSTFPRNKSREPVFQ
jgi:hypothetical protein